MFYLISMVVITLIAVMMFRVLARATEMAAQKAAKRQEDKELEEAAKTGDGREFQPVNRLKKYGL